MGFAFVQQSSIVELFNAADKLARAEEPQKAADLYKAWIAGNGGSELLHAVYFNYGVALSKLGDHAGAINALRASIRLKPDFYPPYINLGRALEDTRPTWNRGRRMAGAGRQSGQRQRRCGQAQADGPAADRPRARATNTDSAAEDALKQSLEINSSQPRGDPALDCPAAAAMQMAGRGGLGARRGEGVDAPYLAAVAGQPCRRSDVPTRQGLSLRQGQHRHSRRVRRDRRLQSPGGANPGSCASAMCPPTCASMPSASG